MKPIKTIVADIVVELTRLQAVPVARRSDDHEFGLPRMIAAGDGGSLVVSKKIDDAIAEVARRLMDNDPKLKSRYTLAEWRAAVRRAFGPALATIDLDDKPAENAQVVLQAVRETLSKDQSRQVSREHAFGCTLFSDKNIAAFAVGPVRFETRVVWLARQAEASYISKVTARRIGRVWQGERIAKRKVSRESLREKDILGAIGSSPFVCSVVTTGFGDEAAKEKARTAARLSLAAIALLWQTPSKALSGFNLLFDRSVRSLKTLTFVPKNHVLSGSYLSHMPDGPWLKPGEWEKLLEDHRDHFAVAGEMIDYLLSPTGQVSRPKLMNTLAQSLLWFHEGCRETVSLMGIVKFSASMDALALGGKSTGIRKLITARIGLTDEKPIRRDGPTMKAAIETIYGDGRSRTLHGSNEELGHDWSGAMGLAEQFARLCLISCMDWASEDPTLDDPRLFLKSSAA
ncbi:hypothetical protein [Hyphomicrobium sp.]|uniref:hypothetical protein n=1 Tax=Hyphomicrobium sp. TaxID=82 RepID=UPI003F6FE2A4